MKKIIACLLASLFCLTALVSCGDIEKDGSTTTSASDTAPGSTASENLDVQSENPSVFDELERRDFGGHVFNIYYYSSDGNETDFLAESETGDIQNDLIYARNLAVMEAYNVGIHIDYINTELTRIHDQVKKQVQAGDQTYDMFGGTRDTLSLSYGGFMYDLSTVSTLSLENEWWDQGYVDAMTIGGSLYTVIGDMGVSTLLFPSGICFNKSLFDASHIAYPYDDVRAGKWTYERLQTILTDVAADLDSDGKIDFKTDRMGLVGWGGESPYSALYTTGFRFMEKGADGEYALNFDQERLTNILERACSLWNMEGSHLTYTGSHPEHNELYGVFAQGRAYTADISLLKIGIFFTGMEDDYGIVPTPKYDEAQEGYHSYVGFTVPIAFMASNAADPERTGLLMEAFGRASYEMVTPKMLEIVTKLKNVRDEDSAEMIEIIYRNKVVDTAHWFKLPGFGTFPLDILKSGSASGVAARVRGSLKAAEKQWDIILKNFEKLKKAG